MDRIRELIGRFVYVVDERLEAVGHLVDFVDDVEQLLVDDVVFVLVVDASCQLAAADPLEDVGHVLDEVGHRLVSSNFLGLVRMISKTAWNSPFSSKMGTAQNSTSIVSSPSVVAVLVS